MLRQMHGKKHELQCEPINKLETFIGLHFYIIFMFLCRALTTYNVMAICISIVVIMHRIDCLPIHIHRLYHWVCVCVCLYISTHIYIYIY